MRAKEPFLKTLILTSLISILLASGCTNTTVTGGKGISVTAFTPDNPEIYSGEPVTFTLLMRNDGSVKALNAHAELLGLDEDWCSSKATNDCKNIDGQRLEKLPNEDDCKYKGTGFNLLGTDKDRGITGQEKTCTWSYKAPPLTQGFTFSYVPTARIFYSYKSSISKLITFDSSDDLKRIRDSGGALPSETTASTDSPVQLTVETSGPIRYSENKVVFPLKISIKNTGNGMPCSTGQSNVEDMKDACKGTQSGEDAKNKLTLKIMLPDNMAFMDEECRSLLSGKTIALLKGENSLACDVQASNLNLQTPVQKTITAEAFYEYFFDTTSSIKVIGRRSADTGVS